MRAQADVRGPTTGASYLVVRADWKNYGNGDGDPEKRGPPVSSPLCDPPWNVPRHVPGHVSPHTTRITNCHSVTQSAWKRRERQFQATSLGLFDTLRADNRPESFVRRASHNRP